MHIMDLVAESMPFVDSDTTGQLSQQLGKWLYPAHELRRQWHAYYAPKDRL